MARARIDQAISREIKDVIVTARTLEDLIAVAKELGSEVGLTAGRYRCDGIADIVGSPKNERMPIVIVGRGESETGDYGRRTIRVAIEDGSVQIHSSSDDPDTADKVERMCSIVSREKWGERDAFLSYKTDITMKTYQLVGMISWTLLAISTLIFVFIPKGYSETMPATILGYVLLYSLILGLGTLVLQGKRESWIEEAEKKFKPVFIRLSEYDVMPVFPKSLSLNLKLAVFSFATIALSWLVPKVLDALSLRLLGS